MDAIYKLIVIPTVLTHLNKQTISDICHHTNFLNINSVSNFTNKMKHENSSHLL